MNKLSWSTEFRVDSFLGLCTVAAAREAAETKSWFDLCAFLEERKKLGEARVAERRSQMLEMG